MPRVIHFEIGADDPQRAVDFYSNVFGWSAQKWPGPMDYWLISTGDPAAPGINGGISQSRGPASHTNVIDVPSVDEFTEKISANGGQVIVPKHTIPGVGYLAYCKDTEGCTFGIMQADQAAA